MMFKQLSRSHRSNPRPPVLGSIELRWIRTRLILYYLVHLWKKVSTPQRTYRLFRKFIKGHRIFSGMPLMPKAAKVDGRYYWRLGYPGFPSRAASIFLRNELVRLEDPRNRKGLTTLFLAMTKRCPLKCEHCFEWDNLNQKEKLSLDNLRRIIRKYQDYGTTQIIFSGGEPLMRYDDILALLSEADHGTDFWIITSGAGMHGDRAKQLKRAGLTGMAVSLDDHRQIHHDSFRGLPGIYQKALDAVAQARKEDLVVALSLCLTRSFTTRENLASYMDLAKSIGVTFVQFLEPRAKGRFAGKDVALNTEQLEMLEDFYLRYNSEAAFRGHPLINYLGYHQRRLGCLGAGNRFLYIDTDGQAQICPFCTGASCNAMEMKVEETLQRLSSSSCNVFAKSETY